MIKQILTLLEQHSPQQAYQLAKQNEFELEGNYEFDYVLGLAAQANSKHNQAIFSFERVLATKPNWLLPRYALAKSYYAVNNLSAALVEFKQVKNNAATNEFPQLDRYIQTIEKLTAQADGIWLQNLQFGIGSDSNANSGIDDTEINIPLLGNVTLFDDSKSKASNFVDYQYQSTFIKPINLNRQWYSMAKLRYADYQKEKNLSRLFIDLFAGYQHIKKANTYNINVFYRPLWLGSSISAESKYLDYYGVNSSFKHTINNKKAYGVDLSLASLAYQKSDYQNNDNDLDKSQHLINAWYQLTQQVSSSKLLVNVGQEQAKNNQFEHLGRNFYGINYQLTYPFNTNNQLTANIAYTRSRYQAMHPLFNRLRKDEIIKATLLFQKHFTPKWVWQLQASYIRNHSNLVIYDHQRNIVSTAISYQF